MMNHKEITVADMVKDRTLKSQNIKKSIERTKEMVAKIRSRFSTKECGYPCFKESFEYVDNLYPEANVKKVILCSVTEKTLESCGMGFAGGFYDKISGTIVFASSFGSNSTNSSVKAKITQDEVIVHELLHYCYHVLGKFSSNRNVEEEFAYGWSMPYLRSKGYSDEEIVKNNYLPFFCSISKEKCFKNNLSKNEISIKQWNSFPKYKKISVAKKMRKKVDEDTMEMALERGRKLVRMYSRKEEDRFVPKGRSIKKSNRFGLIDLDD